MECLCRESQQQHEHPLLEQARRLLKQLRQEGSPVGQSEQTQPLFTLLGPFRREEDQTTYYYDIISSTEVHESELPVPSTDFIIPQIVLERLIAAGLIPDPEPPQASTSHLTFYGWWFEDYESTDLTLRVSSNSEAGGGIAPRHATLEYNLQGGTYNLTLNNSPKPASSTHLISAAGTTRLHGLTGLQLANGQPAGIWDLHVGVTVKALGRTITLKKASMQTTLWHEQYSKKLSKLKSQLLADLQKYKPRGHAAAVVADKGSKREAAGLELRRLALQVRAMAQDLRQYRPTQGMCHRSFLHGNASSAWHDPTARRACAMVERNAQTRCALVSVNMEYRVCPTSSNSACASIVSI